MRKILVLLALAIAVPSFADAGCLPTKLKLKMMTKPSCKEKLEKLKDKIKEALPCCSGAAGQAEATGCSECASK